MGIGKGLERLLRGGREQGGRSTRQGGRQHEQGLQDPNERSYHVRVQHHGVTVTEAPTGASFFRTNAGGWFWEAHTSPFGEDATVGPELSQYLDGIVEDAKTPTQKE